MVGSPGSPCLILWKLRIFAPTVAGAGKTNIAMLTILHEIKQHIHQAVIKKDEFKEGV